MKLEWIKKNRENMITFTDLSVLKTVLNKRNY